MLNRFYRWFYLLIPIKKSELTYYGVVASLFFLAAFVYNILRPLKLAFVISAPNASAQIIAYLKVWGILPSIFIFTYIFSRLSQLYKREKVFYILMSIFVFFFLFFLCLVFPNQEFYALDTLSDFLSEILPQGMGGLILMIRYWYFSLFYIFSELWGTIILTVLLWGFVNETTDVGQARRFYPTFALSANIAAFVAGRVSYDFSLYAKDNTRKNWFFEDSWFESVFLILSSVILCCFLILILYRILSKKFDNISSKQPSPSKTKKESSSEELVDNFTVIESMKLIYKSKYLFYLAIIVFSYNFVFNILDVIWTNQLRIEFNNNPEQISLFMSKITMVKGLLATFLALFITSKLIKKFGWFVAAAFTPIGILITSIFFFYLFFFKDSYLSFILLDFLSMSALTATVYIGGFQNCLTRASKYTLFDATKEMAYIPLDVSSQRQAKASVDAIGSRMGKSGGSLFFQILWLFVPTMLASIPYASFIVLFFLCLWIYAAFGLNLEMKKKISNQ